MKTLEQKISVMQAAVDGKEIEAKYPENTPWVTQPNPIFSWDGIDYRIKPEPIDLNAKIADLESKLEKVFNAGLEGIGHVAMANYASREAEATEKLESAMYGETE